jgi:succinate dehydrogenase / fumarate reductase, cytochrome b subunit
MGLWLIIYLIEHLIVNSQAVLWVGQNGSGFVRLVNTLESLPYLQVIEVLFIGVPLVLHGYWGVKRALKAKMNIARTDGGAPEMKETRNRAFGWQRWTSWILLFGILAHVVQMRFIEMPKKVQVNGVEYHQVKLKMEPSVVELAKKIGVELKDGVAMAPTPGKAMLLMVRETFKSLPMCVVYSVFVLAAAFHAFNGFWTALITWGVILSYRSQKAFLPLCWLGATVLSFLGLSAIWGSYLS